MAEHDDRDSRPFGVRGEISEKSLCGAESPTPGENPAGGADSNADGSPNGTSTSGTTGSEPDPAGASGVHLTPDEIEEIRARIVHKMKSVYDPEIPVDIYELGMIYTIDVAEDGNTLVTMTLTSPACPVAGTLPGEVEDKLNEVDGVTQGKVDLVWDPPWTPDLMSESAKLELGML